PNDRLAIEYEEPIADMFCPSSGESRPIDTPNHSGRRMVGKEKYECPECGNTLSNNTSLKSHMRIHTGEKPFTCPYCNNLFRESNYRNRHIRLIHGMKPYSCLSCDEKFDTKAELSE
ncbi:hypothetical protein PMAYCL1PPCAC_19577, partial [Pristionchus mayeri]